MKKFSVSGSILYRIAEKNFACALFLLQNVGNILFEKFRSRLCLSLTLSFNCFLGNSTVLFFKEKKKLENSKSMNNTILLKKYYSWLKLHLKYYLLCKRRSEEGSFLHYEVWTDIIASNLCVVIFLWHFTFIYCRTLQVS